MHQKIWRIFIVAQFEFAQFGNSPNVYQGINALIHIHTMEHYSALKRQGNIAIFDNLDEPGG